MHKFINFTLMTKNKTESKEKIQADDKVPVAGRVDKDAANNGNKIAAKFGWSMSQVINLALKVVTEAHVVETFKDVK